MSDREAFLTWVRTALYEAERALHQGDPAPRRAIWSRNEPVSVLGAWRNAHGQREVDQLFTDLGKSFSDCTSYEFELPGVLGLDWRTSARPLSPWRRRRRTAERLGQRGSRSPR